MKMKRVSILWAVAAVAVLTSCTKEEAGPASDNRVANFTAGISTRASGTAWDNNDAIGVYMKKAGATLSDATIAEAVSNFKHVTPNGDGVFKGATPGHVAYFPVDGSSVDFIAYFPYAATVRDYSYPIDVRSQSNLPAIDVMYSNNATSKTKIAPAVSLTFKHKLTNLIVNVSPGAGLAASDLVGVTIDITAQKIAGAMSLADGAVTSSGTADKVIALKMTATSGEAIILPSEAVADRTIVMTISTGEKFIWTIPSTTEFVSGKKYIYNATIDRTEMLVTSSITDWEAGNGANGEDVNAGQPDYN